jgi:hypothetical protein
MLKIDIKHKTCDIRNWEKHLILDISSTNIDTLVPSLYLCVETRSTEIFRLLSQLLPHPVGHNLRRSNILERNSQPICERLYTTNSSHCKQKIFFMNILCIEPFFLQKTHNITLLFSNTLLKHGRHFDY